MTTRFYIKIFWQLLQEELVIYKSNFLDKIINLSIWVSCTAGIFGYIMPAFGLSANFGSFQLAGLIASAGLFEVFPSVMVLVKDFDGDRVIDYHLTLPIPSWMILLKKLVYYAINCFSLCLGVIPIGKLVLWHQFDLSKIAIFPFLTMAVLISVFYGALTLWLASKVVNITKIGNVWMRFIFPLWFLGGFQFSWKVLHSIFPSFAYANLLNPLTYVMEGMRATLLGQEGYLNVWYCMAALVLFIVLCWWQASTRLKARLDFV